MNIDGYELLLTCGACPEQYDVYKDGKEVGYLRLRHGYFYAEAPFGGETVYETGDVKGDGRFLDDERDYHLRRAVRAIHAKLTGEHICPSCGQVVLAEAAR